MNDQISHIFILIFRLAYDTKPDLVLNLLLREWCLERPKLLITTTGGKANFELQPRIKRSLRRGLLKAAKVTFIYYVRTCRGEEGSENGHFCLLSVLKICLCRGEGVQKSLKMCLRNIWMVPRLLERGFLREEQIPVSINMLEMPLCLRNLLGSKVRKHPISTFR